MSFVCCARSPVCRLPRATALPQREANHGGPPTFAYLQQIVRSTSTATAQSQAHDGVARSKARWRPVPTMDHLACFAPGLLALGDMELGDARGSGHAR
jgi:hypothetical protein